eukprot:scaffold67862_cov48-Cyclotella_meneghiniana.AAC.2
MGVFGSVEQDHSSWTVPMSDYEYNEWSDKQVEMIFSVGPTFRHPEWVCLDLLSKITAAGLFQCLIMSIMDGQTRLRLKLIVHNGHHNS